ncbi:MAG: hypothetical protein ACRD0J_15795, partial [Acidimicrobiales bacterium]
MPRSIGLGLRADALSLALGLGIAALVCFPFFGGGRLLLLDWVLGPHQPIVPAQAYGLAGGVVAGLPLNLVLAGLAHVLGPAATWVPIAAFFPVASLAVPRLVGDSLVARVGAGFLYCVNPFVFDRLYAGQVGMLLGYALLPFAVASLVRAPDQGWLRGLGPVLWLTALIGCSVHFVWIGAVIGVVVVAQRRLRPRAVAWGVLVGAGVVATSAYLLLSAATGPAGVTAGAADLAAYRTAGDPRVGLLVNVAGLYGFWRSGPVLSKDVVTGWPFLLLAIVVVATWGAWRAVKRPDRGSLAIVLVAAGAIGYLLALGDQGPTGALFRWAYFHVPFFDVMREPQKFACLVALAYAVLFGWGVESLAASSRRWMVPAGIAVAVALPLGYTPTMFAGLDGQVRASHVSSSWATADALMGQGSGQVLFLPWHEYLAFPFTAGRAVANPAQAFFRRPVISGDEIGLPHLQGYSSSARSAFLEDVFAHGSGVSDLGALLAPLDVRYVVLAKTVDWRRYRWVAHQTDLSLVLDTPTLEVWRNDVPSTPARRTTRAVLTTSRASLLAGAGPAPPVAPPGAARRSQVSYVVDAGPPGWLELAQPYERGWFLQG